MEKITLSNVLEISQELAKDKSSFFFNPFYLLENCYFEKKDGVIFVGQPSAFREGQFNYINVTEFAKGGEVFTLLFEEEVKKLEELGLKIVEKTEIGIEFFYKTVDYQDLEGPEFSSIRKKIKKLEKEFQINVLNSYDKAKVIDFINEWSKSKNINTMEEKELKAFNNELKSNIDAFDQLELIPNKTYFIEVNEKLVGFRITVPQNNDNWVGVFQKVNHNFKGLNEYIYHISSQDYKETPWFTTGAAGGSEGLSEHKRNMHPKKEKAIYFVKTA